MKKFKIICIAQEYNELEKGNLKRFLKFVLPLVDDLIIFDDGSTDKSYEYLKRIGIHLIHYKENDFINEINHKRLLLEKAKKLGANFVLWLDIDEILTNITKKDLYNLCLDMIEHDIDGLSMHEINIWRSGTWQRMDSLYNIGWFVRLWKITEQTVFPIDKKGLHQQQYPSSLKNVVKTFQVSVLHYGFSSEKNLAYKYLTYKAFGQKGYNMLDRLINEEKLELKKVPKKSFPKQLYIVREKKPKRKKIEQSLAFVEKYKKKVIIPKYPLSNSENINSSIFSFSRKNLMNFINRLRGNFYPILKNCVNDVFN